jgi:flagellar hook-associated protein 3 FlgL
MTRVSSNSIQQSTIESISRAQEKMGTLQLQLATGKKASTYRDLGADTTKVLTARTALDRTQAFQGASKQLTNTLNLYDIKFGQLNTLSDNLKAELSQKSDGSSASLVSAVEQAFAEFRGILNSDDAGFAMFAAPKGEGEAFKLTTLTDAALLVGETDSQADDRAFGTSTGKNSTLVAEGVSMAYGADARTTGSQMLAAFRTLANEWPLSSPLTSAQSSAIDTAITQINQAQLGINGLTAENGANLKRLEDIDDLANRRTETLNQIVSSYEDANIPEVASKISQQKSLLESSYALFSQLSGLSLVNYLRN